MSSNVQPLTEEEFNIFFEDFFHDLITENSQNNNINKKKHIIIMIRNFKTNIFDLVFSNRKYKEIILNKEKNKTKYLYFVSIFKSSIIYFFSKKNKAKKSFNTLVKLCINNINKIKNNNQTNIFNSYEQKYIEELKKFKNYNPEYKIDKFYKDVCIYVLNKLLLEIKNMKEKGTTIIDIKKYEQFIKFIKDNKEEMISKINNNIDKNNGSPKFRYINYITLNNEIYTDKYNNFVKTYGDYLINSFFNKNPNI